MPIQAVTVRSEKELTGGPGAAAEKAPPAATAQATGDGARKPRREPLRKVVFVVENGTARIRPVETGLASDTEIEIVSGLKEGEKIVEGPYRVLSRELAEGKRITEEAPGGRRGAKGGKG